jgi:dynactin 6
MAASSNKRRSVLPSVLQAGPKAPVKLSSTIVIADSAILTGVDAITIGSDSVVHPRAKLESSRGPVNVGRRCIISERSHVGASAIGSEADDAPNTSTAAALDDFVTIEVGAVIEAGGTTIGEGSTIGAGARIGKGAIVGKVGADNDPTACSDAYQLHG